MLGLTAQAVDDHRSTVFADVLFGITTALLIYLQPSSLPMAVCNDLSVIEIIQVIACGIECSLVLLYLDSGKSYCVDSIAKEGNCRESR
jgi:hypothetical protein